MTMSSFEKHRNEPVRIVGLSGSLRSGSRTHAAVEAALSGASSTGTQVRMLDLAKYDLPFCDGSLDPYHYSPGVPQLRKEVRDAHGIILGTPDYHGGVSGVLKNALDLMSADEFSGKVVGLVGVGGGAIGAFDALNCLRLTSRSLHAWVVPEQVAIPHSNHAFDSHGKLRDDQLSERLHSLGVQVAKFATLHDLANASDFLAAWESAPPEGSEPMMDML